MAHVLKQLAVGLPIFLILDMLWIGVVANDFYRRELGDLLRKSGDNLDPRIAPAAVLYTLMVFGLAFFAVPKARGTGEAWLYGALFGLICYAVYDLTNYATLTNYSLRMTMVDMAWGTVLNGTVAAAMYYYVVR